MEGNNNNNINKVIYEGSVDDNCAANQTFASSPSSSTSGCVSGDDTSEGKSAVPASLVTAENYLTISEVLYVVIMHKKLFIQLCQYYMTHNYELISNILRKCKMFMYHVKLV